MTEDVPFYVELAREADGPVVELAVGNGRVAIPVAQATGRPLLGIDISPAMLAQARANAEAAGVELELREGDMRDLALDEPAALDLLPVPRRCCTCRPGPTGGASSSGSPPRCAPAGASPGTHSSSTRTSRRELDGQWHEDAPDPAPRRPRAGGQPDRPHARRPARTHLALVGDAAASGKG